MLHLSPRRVALLALLAVLATGAAAPGTASTAAATGGGPPVPAAAAQLAPGATAAAYLHDRAVAELSGALPRRLAGLCLPGSRVATHEAAVAAGAHRLAAGLGHRVVAVHPRVRLTAVRIDETRGTAIVHAHVVTMTDWLDGRGRRNTEGEGLDHAVTLIRRGLAWFVAGDEYLCDTLPQLLEQGGATSAEVRAAGARLERAARRETPPGPVAAPDASVGAVLSGDPVPAAAQRLGYVGTATYDRDAAKAYADRYALAYNPTYVAFSSDCANFGSQVMFAGGYPGFGSGYESGWWYSKKGTSSPSDDSYSHAWIAVVNQRGAWIGKYADTVSSIGDIYRGDFVYYDWTGDGTWDHVAEFAGTNSAGQKVVDAHTTDHYHVFWKLGTSATRYALLHTRTSVVV